MTPEQIEALANETDESVVRALVQVREALQVRKTAYEKLESQYDADIESLSNELLRRFIANGTDSVRVAGVALVSKRTKRVYSCADWAVFNGWLVQQVQDKVTRGLDPTDVFAMFEKRLSAVAIAAHMEENNNELPPAVNSMAKVTIAVTKSK